MNAEILQPIAVLVAWSMIMWLWLYATRIPALLANKDYDAAGSIGTTGADIRPLVPARTQWKADNYNHLMEQPTAFYAAALTLALLGAGNGGNATIAWVYVGFRIVHSLVQATVNRVPVRFFLHALGTIPLLMLATHAVTSAFGLWSLTAGALLAPAAVLVLWTLIMLSWTAYTRFPAVARSGIDLKKAKPGGRGQDLETILPPNVMWKAHNHTHLHEQPTLFYAVVGILAVLGAATTLNVALAWAYVALRIVHSIYQATINVVRVRFLLFFAATICLVALAINALLAAL